MKRVYFGEREGIDMQFTRSTGRLDVAGWYDTFVGIAGRSFTLAEWGRRLGIRPADYRRAAAEMERAIAGGDA